MDYDIEKQKDSDPSPGLGRSNMLGTIVEYVRNWCDHFYYHISGHLSSIFLDSQLEPLDLQKINYFFIIRRLY